LRNKTKIDLNGQQMRNWNWTEFVWRRKASSCRLGVRINLSFLCNAYFKYSLVSFASFSEGGGGETRRYRFEAQMLSNDLYSLKQDKKLDFLERREISGITSSYTFAGRYELELTAYLDCQRLWQPWPWLADRFHVVESSN
jgi:hypothetical protein